MKTPRPNTPDFAELQARLRGAFAQPALVAVASGALDRNSGEKIIAKLTRGRHGELARLSRHEVMCDAVAAFFARDDGAHQLIKELDRATRAERSLVAGMSGAEAGARLTDHKALRLKRHGAKLVWALARDGREAVRGVGRTVLAAYLGHMDRLAEARSGARDKGAESEVRQLEETYRGAAERALDLEFEVSEIERERARLVAEVGRREMELRRAADQRQDLAAQIDRLRQELAGEAPASGSAAARDTRAAHEGFGAEHARAAELEEENARLRHSLDRLRELRVSERVARRGLIQSPEAESTKTTPVVEAPRRGRAKHNDRGVRVGVYVDVANLAGAARRLHNAAVDYARLLATLVCGRRLVSARAYAIDKGGGFDAFAHALRRAGYRVVARKPKVMPDGSMKADWDVGITVDMLTQHDKLDVVILGSGDGDFVPAVNALKREGLRVEGAGFPGRSANILVRAVDGFIELGEDVLGPGNGA